MCLETAMKMLLETAIKMLLFRMFPETVLNVTFQNVS